MMTIRGWAKVKIEDEWTKVNLTTDDTDELEALTASEFALRKAGYHFYLIKAKEVKS